MSEPTRPAGPDRAPRPGRPVRGSTSGHPVNALFDLLGRRWALTCLWALRDGPRTFREIQGGDRRISPSSLNTRLAELRAAGLVTRTEGGYAVTALGADLLRVGEPLVEWAHAWSAALEGDQGDPQ